MKRIKTTVRNSIGDNRLTDLTLIPIYRNIGNSLDGKSVVDVFREKKRRIKFIN